MKIKFDIPIDVSTFCDMKKLKKNIDQKVIDFAADLVKDYAIAPLDLTVADDFKVEYKDFATRIGTMFNEHVAKLSDGSTNLLDQIFSFMKIRVGQVKLTTFRNEVSAIRALIKRQKILSEDKTSSLTLKSLIDLSVEHLQYICLFSDIVNRAKRIPEDTSLTPTDLVKLFASAKSRTRIMINFLMVTGFNVNEMISLRACDVDRLKNDEIVRINRETMTENHGNFVYITAAQLARILQTFHGVSALDSLPTNSYIFQTRHNSPYKRNNIYTMLKSVATSAGIDWNSSKELQALSLKIVTETAYSPEILEMILEEVQKKSYDDWKSVRITKIQELKSIIAELKQAFPLMKERNFSAYVSNPEDE